jgi:hypothetical protein
MLWALAIDLLELVKDHWVLAAIVAGLLVAGIVLYRIATSRKKKPVDLEGGLRERLADYPPPPAAGPKRLSINGEPVRLRLVVVCPTGKLQDSMTADGVAEQLDDVVRGLGAFVQSDKPRVKIWPPQLSVAGFAPTFHRLIESPDGAGKPSRWIKLAGPARTGRKPILLGIAAFADEPCKLGDVVVETTEWGELLEIQR